MGFLQRNQNKLIKKKWQIKILKLELLSRIVPKQIGLHDSNKISTELTTMTWQLTNNRVELVNQASGENFD